MQASRAQSRSPKLSTVRRDTLSSIVSARIPVGNQKVPLVCSWISNTVLGKEGPSLVRVQRPQKKSPLRYKPLGCPQDCYLPLPSPLLNFDPSTHASFFHTYLTYRYTTIPFLLIQSIIKSLHYGRRCYCRYGRYVSYRGAGHCEGLSHVRLCCIRRYLLRI